MNILLIPCRPGEISDGYHTFDELYEHRCSLFLMLMKAYSGRSWFSRKHEDGAEWDSWFIAGICGPTGDISYHLPIKMWDLAIKTDALKLERGAKWDGHTPAQVVERLQEWAKRD